MSQTGDDSIFAPGVGGLRIMKDKTILDWNESIGKLVCLFQISSVLTQRRQSIAKYSQ